MLSPYFASLARQKRVCPDCLRGVLRIEPTPRPRPDMAVEVCDRCGYFQLLEAPAGTAPVAGGRIIRVDFGRSGRG